MISYLRYSTFLSILLLATGIQLVRSQSLQYPSAKQVDVVDDFFGTRVADPYRWMEEANTDELKEWIDAENNLTRDFLSGSSDREKIKARLTELWNYPRYSVPSKHGNRYFFMKNSGLQNQSVLYMQERLDGIPAVVIDPNTLSEDGTTALTNQSYNEDGSLLAYGISRSGSDWQEIRIRDVVKGKDYDDVLLWCKFSSIAWSPDNKGFYYNRFPEPGTLPKEEESYHNAVYWHTLGTHQLRDKLVYERPDAKDLSFSPTITEDGKYLILRVWRGTDPQNRLYYRETGSGGQFVRLLDDADAAYSFVANDSSVFYIETNLDAPRGRIIAIDLNHPERKNWKQIVPEQRDAISFATVVHDRFVISFMHDAHHELRVFNLDGSFADQLELPALGAVSGLSGRREDSEMFFSFTSFVYPTMIFRYDFTTHRMISFRRSEIKFDASPYETKQVFYYSKDGTRVPMFITYKKGTRQNGNCPTLLSGYGGFNISFMPSFLAWRLAWLENGGIFATANLRGGNEYGEEWHQGGMLENKQNVFDDFIAAARYLIDQKYTRPSRLAIIGGSNGGLLVAACMLQQPTLFGAVICRVPVTDMLRYHKFTVGRYWVGEYGNAETNWDDFDVLYKYSPLHNVKVGVSYPPILITTADHDDRVVPAHAMKFASALQAAQSGPNPVLIRIDTNAGHGGGKPTSKEIDEYADIFAFLFKMFKVSLSSIN